MQEVRPTSSGYAGAAEGLEIYYEVYGEGEPIVVLAGGLMPISTLAQITGPLSDTRQVIAIDPEGHGRTGLRDTPMSPERNGDDIAAVLRPPRRRRGRRRRLLPRWRRRDLDGRPASGDGAQPDRDRHRICTRRLVSGDAGSQGP